MKKKLLSIALLSSATVFLGMVSTSHAQNCSNGPNAKNNGTDTIICSSNNDDRSGYTEWLPSNGGATFYSWFENTNDGNANFLRVYDDQYSNHFRVEFDLPLDYGSDVVGGTGWEFGWVDRKIGYWIGQFSSTDESDNHNQYKAIIGAYGWTCSSSANNAAAQEYYIVDEWSGNNQFIPWDENKNQPATPVNDDVIDGGTYDVYVLDRNGPQYCGDGGPKAFKQYWSVRKGKRGRNQANIIDFRKHSDKWDNYGFRADRVDMGYQIIAGEAFGNANYGHSGAMDMSVWEAN